MTERPQPSVSDRHLDRRPVGHSVWLTAQTSSRDQRAGRYLTSSRAHPDPLPPAIARHAIQRYTRPGDLVIDPLCGTGTTLVEAVHLGRDALGVEVNPSWADLTERNLALAATTGATGLASVVTGDARDLPHLLTPLLHRPATLILTNPPTGPDPHRHQVPHHDGGDTAANAGHTCPSVSAPPTADLDRLPAPERRHALTQILTAALGLLQPGGLVVLTGRARRHGRHLTDPAGDLIGAASAAGLTLTDRCAALLTGLRDDCVVPRVPVGELQELRGTQGTDHPLLAVAHQDILVFDAPPTRGASR